MNAFDLTDYVEVAGALVVGLWLGRRSSRGRPDVVRPMCSCGHGFGHHVDGQRCAHEEKVRLNGVDGMEPCGCQRYDGPDPVVLAWAPQ